MSVLLKHYNMAINITSTTVFKYSHFLHTLMVFSPNTGICKVFKISVDIKITFSIRKNS